ncbi:MAG: isochorismate synthase [Armatimonadetes bacterium]|nr:isochorismate synthase [Armatimonadota bacterium]
MPEVRAHSVDAAVGVLEQIALASEAAARKARSLGRPVLAWAAAAIPDVDPVDLFEHGTIASSERILWIRPDERFNVVGIGTAWSFTPEGPDRFRLARAAWRECLDEAVGAGDLDDGGTQPTSAGPVAGSVATRPVAVGPVALGGFAFSPNSPATEEWEGYPAGALVVPRIAVWSDAAVCWLILAAMVRPEDHGVDGDDAGIARVIDAVASGRRLTPVASPLASASPAASAAPLASPESSVRLEEDPPADRWKEMVREAVSAVRQGRLRKVVLARAVRVRGVATGVGDVLQRLRAGYPGCAIFAVARGDRCFLGATPERLVRVFDGTVSTTAVAGSAPRGRTEDEDRRFGEGLLSSAKDRIEHGIVVETLREVFSSVCAEVSIGAEPVLLKVANVQHLCTPIEGRLADHLSIFDLIDRLHPTPAVGGMPSDAALHWVAEHEGLERGWYAGPVGWVDCTGNGEFAVAIRSALLRGSEAILYAGCGIVADSDPDAEYEESQLKLRPLVSALGAEDAEVRRR